MLGRPDGELGGGRDTPRASGAASPPAGAAFPLPEAWVQAGLGGPVALGAGLRGPIFPAFLPPSRAVLAAGPMSAERREREAARWARPSHGALAAAPTLSLRSVSRRRIVSPGLATRSPRARRP